MVRKTRAHAGLALVLVSATAGTVVAQQPVQPAAIVHRSEFTAAEWTVLQNGMSMVIGLSNHGYDFPGSIETFRVGNGTTPVLSYVELSAIHLGNAVDDRFDQYDVVEDAFFHSTDPASLRALAADGGVTLTWMRDSRDTAAPHYTPPGVVEYVIEVGPSEDGPWVEAIPPVPEEGVSFTTVHIAGATSVAMFRVRSRLADDTVVDYSWPQPVATGTRIMSGWLDASGFGVVVNGPDALTAPGDVFIEVDYDRDRVWGESGERIAAVSREANGTGSWLYTGDAALAESVHYRFVIDGQPDATAPPTGESYPVSRRNNRLATSFSAFLTKPGHPVTQTVHLLRLEDALAADYDGVHFDFAYDDFSPGWITGGDVAPREMAEAGTLVDDVSSLLAMLRAARPEATIVFNGYFVVEDEASYDAYLDRASGGAYEFFAFGFEPGATEIHPWSIDAFDGILRSSHLDDKISIAVVEGTPTNIDARLKSLALYLLVAHERVHYVYTTGLEQNVAWFPEWEVPLGDATPATLAGYDDLAHPASSWLAHRTFTNGDVYFNWHETQPVVIDLPRTAYRLEVTGGNDPVLGGDGEANYVAVNQLTIAPRDGAIVITHPHIGEVAGDRFSTAVANVGDVDGDSYADFIVGAPFNDERGDDAGKVYVISGRTGETLVTKRGQKPGDRFGWSVSGAGDVDGDGHDDFMVGAPSYRDRTGRVYVYSGRTGAVLYRKTGSNRGDRFGYAVAGGEDVDDDGRGDFIVGSPWNDDERSNAGRVDVYSGRSGSRLGIVLGEGSGDRFGWSVCMLRKANSDRFADFVVGAPRNDDSGSNAGRVSVYSGKDLSRLYSIGGKRSGDQFGHVVASAGRVNGGGRDDFVVGSPFYDRGELNNAGRVDLFDGRDGERLWNEKGQAEGDRFGWSLSAGGDVNGDGVRDVLVGAPRHGAAGGNAGRVYVRSGTNGATLLSMDGVAAGDQLGTAVADLHDVDDDGLADFVMGAPYSDASGSDAGRVHLVLSAAP